MGKYEILEDDFDNYEKNLHVNFHLNNQAERKMLDDLSEDKGLSNSAYLRYIIIKDWKIMRQSKKDGNL
jgi:hypothetical protein